MKKIFAMLVSLILTLPLSAGQPPTTVPPGTPVHITVSPAAAPAPPVSITLGPREASVTPQRVRFTHTGGRNIDVAQPSPDTLLVTMTGLAAAVPHACQGSRRTVTISP